MKMLVVKAIEDKHIDDLRAKLAAAPNPDEGADQSFAGPARDWIRKQLAPLKAEISEIVTEISDAAVDEFHAENPTATQAYIYNDGKIIVVSATERFLIPGTEIETGGVLLVFAPAESPEPA